MTTPLLKWTGHPLADVGVATICAMVAKDEPSELTLQDLDRAAEQIKKSYMNGVLIPYLSAVYTINSSYTNPNKGIRLADREEAIRRRLFAHRSEPDAKASFLRCTFSRAPATHLIERTQMPMLTGAGVLNFFPAGRSELAVAGPYLVALQALALGGRRSEGQLLVVHCEDPQFTRDFAERFLNDNMRILELAENGALPEKGVKYSAVLTRELPGPWDIARNRAKCPDVKAPFSLVLHDLSTIASESSIGALARSTSSVTAYLLSNGKTPSLQIESIPGSFVSFLQDLNSAGHRGRWVALVQRQWLAFKSQSTKKRKTKARSAKAQSLASVDHSSGPGRTQNVLYLDLLNIFRHGFVDLAAAAKFVSRYLLSIRRLRPARNIFRGIEPVAIPRASIEKVDWILTSLFVERVVGMDKARIEKIKAFADRLAAAIHKREDKGLLASVLYPESRFKFQRSLVAAQVRYRKRRDGELLFGLDEFVQVFLADDATGVVPWDLVHSLISIRLVEVLDKMQREQGHGEFPLFAVVDEPEDGLNEDESDNDGIVDDDL